jgi:hypothetical protein
MKLFVIFLSLFTGILILSIILLLAKMLVSFT